MSFMLGIVGLPNVGKSTLFTALTKKQVDVSNYPFATIDPNVGVVSVPDERLDVLAKLSKSKKTIPTTIEFRDIAGLVKDAHKGEGLGNKFLSHIREVDAIVHVVRHFEDNNVTHVAGKVDPEEDQSTISAELALADLDVVSTSLENLREKSKSGLEKDEQKLLAVLERLEAHLNAGKAARTLELDEEQTMLVHSLQLLTMKPQIIVANVDEETLQKGVEVPGALVLNAKIESEIVELPSEEAKTFLAEYHLKQSGLERLIVASYGLLNLLTFFSTEEKETRAWTIPKGTKAPQAAGRIHTDFEKGFIRAEVISYQDFVDAGGEHQSRDAGTMRMEGKDYVLQDGDIVHFHFQ